MSLFEQPTVIVPDPVIPDNALETLVGEGKKYADTELLAKSTFHKDAHIARLEAEAKERHQMMSTLQDELRTRGRMEELVDKISSSVNKPPSNMQEPPVVNGTTTEKSLTPEQLDKLLDEKLSKVSREKTLTDNLAAVESKLTEVFGNQSVAKMTLEANKLGVSLAFMKQVASENPNAFFRLVGLDQRTQVENVTPPVGISAGAFRPDMSTDRTQKYYVELRRTNPKEYDTPGTRRKMHDDAIRFGEKFFDV